MWDILTILRGGNRKKEVESQKDFSASFVDVSQWQEAQEYTTGGTREKCWLINSKTYTLYFFKVSIKKGDKDYPTEFWMEIIASKIGAMLGLNILDYNIAKRMDKVGCISKHMVAENEGYALVELMYILAGFSDNYNPETDKDKFTVDFVYNALQAIGLEKYIKEFIDVLVFDCIIGNQDRHQENWGLISPQEAKKHIPKETNHTGNIKLYWVGSKVAPVYDSGSSLGREKDEITIGQMLTDDAQTDAYINRYKPEIRIEEGRKITYMEMLKYLLQHPTYGALTRKSIETFIRNYDADMVAQIVMDIDNNLPPDLKKTYGLSTSRKEFVINLINRRIHKLEQFL